MPEANSQAERQQAHFLLVALPEEKVAAVRNLLEVMVEPLSRSLTSAPVEDEELMPEAAALNRAQTSLARGEGVSHGEVLREFGLCEEKVPQRLSIVWSEEGRGDLRRIDRETALDILHCINRYLSSRSGDVKKLKPPQTDFRLRCGDHRLFFEFRNENTIEVLGVRHRREASRCSSLLWRHTC